MRAKAKVLIGSAMVAGVIGGAVGVGIAATSGDDGEVPLQGPSLEQATSAALAHVGGGEVIESETGEAGTAYEVEVRKDDGSVVEVRLDASFGVISEEADDEGAGDEGGSDRD